MKKILVLCLITFAFFNCEDKIEFNTPSFQAKKNGEVWDVPNFGANLSTFNVLTITASNETDRLTLVANPFEAFVCDNDFDEYNGVYSNRMGDCYELAGSLSFGSLRDGEGVFWTSQDVIVPQTQVYKASGAINIRDINLNVEEPYVSGEFYFNGFDPSGLESINFNEGVFINVPIIVDVVDPLIANACNRAKTTVISLRDNYLAVAPGDATYTSICIAFGKSLKQQILYCGDPGGKLKDEFDALNCI